jgi:hypothetical protein
LRSGAGDGPSLEESRGWFRPDDFDFIFSPER